MTFATIGKLIKTRLTLSSLVFALLMAAPAAFAHTHPEDMAPAPDSTVQAPAKITIHFSGALEPKFSTITLTDAAGHVVNKETSVVGSDSKSMILSLPALVPGVYTVKWVGVSVDTHRSEGDYKFTVGQ